MTAAPRQKAFALDHRPALGRSAFLISDANSCAVAALDNWRGWPGRRMALVGPPRSGKTHLAHVWMQETGAEAVSAAELDNTVTARLAENGCAVIEDADSLARLGPDQRAVAETALFHLYNLAAAEGSFLLMTGREAPGRWQFQTPDLASRMAALPVARLAPPDDILLSSVMIKLFADRQIHVGPETVAYVARRIERSFAAAEAAVTALDQLALERMKPVTRKLAAELFDAGAQDGAGE
jgi:chromosomal replication initiation ATPase DnaA